MKDKIMAQGLNKQKTKNLIKKAHLELKTLYVRRKRILFRNFVAIVEANTKLPLRRTNEQDK